MSTELDRKPVRRNDAASWPARRPNASAGPHPAVFLDRDGTLIEDVHFLCDPAQIRPLPGALPALLRLQSAGFRCVLVTNQSAVGRGMITETRLHEIHAEMSRILSTQGVVLDGIYYCPDAPPTAGCPVIPSGNRKPAPGMLLRAAADLGLDLERSWMVGDKITDVQAGLNAGCRSILLVSDKEEISSSEARSLAGGYLLAPDLATAAELILSHLSCPCFEDPERP
jgi:D-glycero-D-manno-heptose 1,7-bisphosphate phosphatase